MGKLKGKRPLKRPRSRWEDDNEMDLTEVEWENMDSIDLAPDKDRWWALVNAVMNLWVPYTAGNSRVVEGLLASQEGLCYMESVS